MQPPVTRLFDLSSRVAVVTGASSGLGVAFAEGLGAAGARVMITARRIERLESVKARLESQGIEVHAVACDVAKDADVERLRDETLERFGQVDILVNNAGVGGSFPAESEPVAHFRQVVAVNLNAVFSCSQAFGKVMLERGSGSIVNVSSMLGLVASGQIPQASYAAAKGAVVNLTRELGAQWARRGVRVNALAPGFFPSEMTGEMLSDDRTLAWIKKRLPIGRTGEPTELLGALLLLASDAGSYIIGQTLVVDGGWTII